MKQAKSQPINETTWRKSPGKSLSTAKRLSPCRTLVKSNASTLDNENDPKISSNGSKIPRPKLSEWCSSEENSNGDLGKSKLKKRVWSVPKSGSIKRCANDKIKSEATDDARNDSLALLDNVSEASQKTWSIPAQRSFIETENSCVAPNQLHPPIRKENSLEFRGQTRDINSNLENYIFFQKETESNKQPYRDGEFGEKSATQKEREGRSARVFGEREKICSKKAIERRERNESGDRISEFENDLSERYEFTLNQISTTWKNAMELLERVKEHREKLAEEGAKTVDKEQVALETEMLQLAIDFAMTYSKLKTDFFIKFARKNLNLKEPPSKTELETFMDSKFFVGSYSEQDLAEMAKTVRDLKASVLETNESDASF